MKPFRVIVTATARDQIREIALWWRAHALDAPDLFLEQLEVGLERLSTAPWSGSPYSLVHPTDIRRILLRRCQYHLYYTVDADAGAVTIRAIWHSARGHGPPLP
jgi:plasmid stabilization system protein ParE